MATKQKYTHGTLRGSNYWTRNNNFILFLGYKLFFECANNYRERWNKTNNESCECDLLLMPLSNVALKNKELPQKRTKSHQL